VYGILEVSLWREMSGILSSMIEISLDSCDPKRKAAKGDKLTIRNARFTMIASQNRSVYSLSREFVKNTPEVDRWL
jgi:hypothetical protein